jgi:hypothetical protein
MRNILMTIVLVVAAPACLAAEEAKDRTAQAECRRAEINPVTGHVFCIDPRGAPVEAPPEELRPECKPDEARGQWSWGPNCAPQPGEM